MRTMIIPGLVTAIATYSAYGDFHTPTESGSAAKKYARSYAWGGLATILGVVLGGTAIFAGEFIAGLATLTVGLSGLFIVGSIMVYDVGSKATRKGVELAKENPEQAAAVASTVGILAGKANEVMNERNERKAKQQAEKERQKQRKEQERQQKKIERKKQYADFSMNCPGCGRDWIYNNGGIVSGQERVGYQVVGSDDILDKTQIQCTDCSRTRKVQRAENI